MALIANAESGLSVRAKLNSLGAFSISNEIALLGDSRAASNFNNTPGPTGQQTMRSGGGWACHVQALTRGAIIFPADLNWAVSGALASDMITTGAAVSAANSRAPAVAIFTGTNSLSANISAASIIADVTTAINLCLAAGKRVFLFAESPRGSSGVTGNRLTSDQLAQQSLYRNWITRRNGARSLGPHVYIVDVFPDVVDMTFNNFNGDWNTAYTYDTTHVNQWGAYIYALRFMQSFGAALGIMPTLLPPQSFLFSNPGDLYSAANVTGNLILNGMLGGTGGANNLSGYGVSGTFPTSWSASGAPGALLGASATMVCSQVTNARGNWYQQVLGGTSPAGTNYYQFTQNLTLGNLSAGDVLQAAMAFEVDAAAAGLAAPYLHLQRNYPSTFESVADFKPGNGAWPTTAGVYEGVMITPPLTLQGNETSVTASLFIQMMPSTALAATVRLGRLSVRKQLGTPIS